MSSAEEWEAVLIADVVKQAERLIMKFLDLCESPIERVMLAALMRQVGASIDFGMFSNVLLVGAAPGAYMAGSVTRSADDGQVLFVPQLEVDTDGPRYRLDIAVLDVNADKTLRQKIAIECDGHEFHDRTKEQATRDRARDRALQSHGWKVLRFTGSDIVRGPTWAAAEVIGFVSGGGKREGSSDGGGA